MSSAVFRYASMALMAMILAVVCALVFKAWLRPGNISLWLQAWIPGLCT